MLLAGVRDLLAAVALGNHDHAAALGLEEIDVAVHAARRGGAETAAGHARRRLGGTGIINRMVLEVLRQLTAGVETLLQLRMRDVAGDDDGAVDEQARGGGVLAELGADFGHGAVGVDAHGVGVLAVAQLFGDVGQGMGFELLDEDAILGDLTLGLTVGGAGDANADGE